MAAKLLINSETTNDSNTAPRGGWRSSVPASRLSSRNAPVVNARIEALDERIPERAGGWTGRRYVWGTAGAVEIQWVKGISLQHSASENGYDRRIVSIR